MEALATQRWWLQPHYAPSSRTPALVGPTPTPCPCCSLIQNLLHPALAYSPTPSPARVFVAPVACTARTPQRQRDPQQVTARTQDPRLISRPVHREPSTSCLHRLPPHNTAGVRRSSGKVVCRNYVIIYHLSVPRGFCYGVWKAKGGNHPACKSVAVSPGSRAALPTHPGTVARPWPPEYYLVSFLLDEPQELRTLQ